MTFSQLPLPLTKKETPCSRRDFIVAWIILNWGQKEKKKKAPKKAPKINTNVERILGIASRIASKKQISLGNPWTTEKILRVLERKWNFNQRGLAAYIKEKVYGTICSTSSTELLQATATAQLKLNWTEKISTDHVILLSRLKNKSMTMTELAKIQGISTPGMTGNIIRLEGLGYAKRTVRQSDKRITDVTLTKKWRDFIDKLEMLLTTT